MNLKSVLFDLDGTLVDSLEDLTDAVNHVRHEFALPPLTPSAVCRMVGKGALNLLRQALPDLGQDEIGRALRLFLDYNEKHIADKSRLYPGVAEMLADLQRRGIRLAVISNKNEALSRLILKSLEIDDYFESVSGGDTFPEIKPSPLPLLRVIERQGVLPQECVMVGDSINDIQAGNLAGIATVGCSWGYGGSAELAGSSFLAESCEDLLRTITGLEQTT
ncbi:MAG: HAD-IA family hydrolase [Geobacteraceae bacterium]|nr:HAD-IA family hydrolase [Geobacteraceae bacterium]